MIPKVIHYVWFSKDEKPDLMKNCMSTWSKVLPDYEIKAWSMKEVEEIRKLPENKFLDEALSAKKWSFATDFLRLWILYNEGGIYLDTDVEVLKSFDPFLNEKFFTCYEYNKTIEAAVMGCEKHSKMAKEFLSIYQNRSFLNDFTDRYGRYYIIPYVLSYYIIDNYKKYRAKSRHTKIDGLHIYPYYYFSPKNKFKKRIETKKNTYTIYHFNGSWLTKTEEISITKFKKFKQNILYFIRNILPLKTTERLFERYEERIERKKTKK